MEALKRTYDQYFGIYKSMSASQRGTLIVVTLMIVGGFGYLMINGASSRYVAASLGKNFSQEEIQTAQQTLREKGLTDFKIEKSQLLVPKSEVDRYDAALFSGGAMPADWASELEKQQEKNGWFSSARQSKAGMQIALAKELRRVIRAHPDIADASVVWARSEPKRFSGTKARVTATVNIQPKKGRELTMQRIHSLRSAVANMVPDLNSTEVTIFDMATGESHTAEKDGAYDGKLVSLIKQHTKRYQDKIEQQLSYIPGVRVSVDVKLENLEAHVEQIRKNDPAGSVPVSEQTISHKDDRSTQPLKSEPGSSSNTPLSLNSRKDTSEKRTVNDTDTSSTYSPSYTTSYKKYIAAMPSETFVSIAIPESYFTKVEEKSQAAAEGGGNSTQTLPNRTQILADVKAIAAHSIGSDPASAKIDVRAFVKIDADVPTLETSWMESLGTAMNQWGGAAGLALFAIWSLWMLKKNMPEMAEASEELAPVVVAPQPEGEEDVEVAEEIKAPQEPTHRDKLQTTVRDNPEMAAAVLSQWLRTAVD
jgi:flagellar M-ring protein FliF